MRKKSILLVCLFALTAFMANASDLQKEKRLQEEVIAGLFDGEPINLDTGELDFLGIWTPAPNDVAVVLLHGTGVHPDWPQVINPLRVQLAGEGWSTLSIQMPVLENEADMDDYLDIYHEVPPRINAAMDFLAQQDYQRIVLLGHSQGSRMAAYYLAQSEHDVVGFIAIGIPGATTSLEKITIPVLDVTGEFDFETILAARSARQIASQHNANYSQVQIDGSDHFHEGNEDQLFEVISAWLKAQ